MKFVIAIATLLLSFSAGAESKIVCMDVKDDMKYSALNTNFDGSITVTEPQVLADGRYVRIAGSFEGYCKSLGKVLVDAKKSNPLDLVNAANPKVEFVELNENGELASGISILTFEAKKAYGDIINMKARVGTKIICR